jgi:hypothetical protein
MKHPIKIGVTGFAECVTSDPATRARKLKPFKFPNKGEGAGRSGYYARAIRAIRKYHASGNDLDVLQSTVLEFNALADAATEKRDKTKWEHNSDTVDAYRRIYGERKFRLLTNHRLVYSIKELQVTVLPDLWVEENGEEVLIKIGKARKEKLFIDVLLHVMWKAARQGGYSIQPRNVVYLDVTNGIEHSCDPALRLGPLVRSIAREIVKLWPSIGEPVKR